MTTYSIGSNIIIHVFFSQNEFAKLRNQFNEQVLLLNELQNEKARCVFLNFCSLKFNTFTFNSQVIVWKMHFVVSNKRIRIINEHQNNCLCVKTQFFIPIVENILLSLI